MKPRLRPNLEHLEARTVPALWGQPWPDAENITLSFAPDGTLNGSVGSTLGAKLGENMSSDQWQLEILKAFHAWTSVANLNISVTADGGQAFGSDGPVQGSNLYGDIRIGAFPLSSHELAVATPFDLLGTQAGDIIVNDTYSYGRNGAPGYDLFTVALQEAGHTLGLNNDAATSSVMYTTYQGPRNGLGTGDATRLQALYGTRPKDRFEGSGGNETNANAKIARFLTSVSQYGSTDPTTGSEPYVVAADITTGADKDTYKFVNPSGSNAFSVQLRTSKLSLLTAKVTVMSSSGVVVASGVAADPRTGDLAVNVPSAIAGGTYYVRVEAADTAFNTGRYRLAVGPAAYAAIFPATTSSFVNIDGHTNDARRKSENSAYVNADADDLGKHEDLPSNRIWENTVRGSIHDGADKDFYKFKSDDKTNGYALVVTAWATDVNRLNPVVRIYNADGILMASETLADDGSAFTVQVRGIESKKEYYVEIASDDPGVATLANTGNYFFSLDVRKVAVELTTYDTGTLTNAAREQVLQFDVSKAREYHLMLTATAASNASLHAVRMTVYDASFNAIASLRILSGETGALDLALAAGRYYVKLSGGRSDGGTLANIAYSLRGFDRNDPIGPQPEDTAAATTSEATTPAPPPARATKITWWGWIDAYSNAWAGV